MPRARKRPVQIREQLGAGQIDLGNRAEEKDDEPHGIRALGEDLREAFAHVFDVEVQQRRFTTDHQHAWRDLVLRMAHAIGEVRRPRNPGELGHAWTRGLPEQEHDGDRGAKQHAVDGAGSQHAEERRDRHEELRPAEPPDVPQRVDVDEADDGGEHDGRQHGLRQVPEQSGGEEHDDQREHGGHQTRERRACARTLVDERLRHAAAHGEPPAEPRERDWTAPIARSS